MVRRLWLVRHGATVWNQEQRFCGQTDIGLSSQGEAQAQWLGEQLHTRSIAALYASDLLRAQQTAAMITQQSPQSLSIKSSSAWREISFGAWEGLTYAQIAARFPDQLAFFTGGVDAAPPDGESPAAFAQRVLMAFVQLTHDVSSLAAGDIVLVSHGGALRALLCIVLHMPLEYQWQLHIEPGSLSALDFVNGSEDVLATTTLTLLNYHA
ncbi:alpha-ribazole phosphatase [Dictyobacter arantiisoli]|uniref:Alpha-ribazole phosphatase n=2 Tax=Dictyobacter arantiisoli TaxID=2014874 RepID=A0A5A5TGP9_9CHLR|nr:alpha-ribazole phosphatase [Dictyobacter arantiisoli]